MTYTGLGKNQATGLCSCFGDYIHIRTMMTILHNVQTKTVRFCTKDWLLHLISSALQFVVVCPDVDVRIAD
jgi:hypothetical protein